MIVSEDWRAALCDGDDNAMVPYVDYLLESDSPEHYSLAMVLREWLNTKTIVRTSFVVAVGGLKQITPLEQMVYDFNGKYYPDVERLMSDTFARNIFSGRIGASYTSMSVDIRYFASNPSCLSQHPTRSLTFRANRTAATAVVETLVECLTNRRLEKLWHLELDLHLTVRDWIKVFRGMRKLPTLKCLSIDANLIAPSKIRESAKVSRECKILVNGREV